MDLFTVSVDVRSHLTNSFQMKNRKVRETTEEFVEY